MLEELLNSKNEASILSFFLVAPLRSFSAIEISKRLGIPYLKATHTLNKLASGNQLVAFSKKNKKYYLLNTKYKLLPEIKTYLLKNGQHYEDELFVAIRKLGEVKAAFLSGIFTGQPHLPVDMLLVGKINLPKLEEFMKVLENMMGQEINYALMPVSEFEVRRHTFDRFIKDIFDYRHVVVVDELSKKSKR
jgi:hypothetical protein